MSIFKKVKIQKIIMYYYYGSMCYENFELSNINQSLDVLDIKYKYANVIFGVRDWFLCSTKHMECNNPFINLDMIVWLYLAINGSSMQSEFQISVYDTNNNSIHNHYKIGFDDERRIYIKHEYKCNIKKQLYEECDYVE